MVAKAEYLDNQENPRYAETTLSSEEWPAQQAARLDSEIEIRDSAFQDEKAIRRGAVTYRVPCITTLSGARAAADAVAARRRDPIRVWSLQEIHSAKTVA